MLSVVNLAVFFILVGLRVLWNSRNSRKASSCAASLTFTSAPLPIALKQGTRIASYSSYSWGKISCFRTDCGSCVSPINCLARFSLLSFITMSFPPQPFLKPTKPKLIECSGACGSLVGVQSGLAVKSSWLWAALVCSSGSELVVSVSERASSSCEESNYSLAGSGSALYMNYKFRTSKQAERFFHPITVFSK